MPSPAPNNQSPRLPGLLRPVLPLTSTGFPLDDEVKTWRSMLALPHFSTYELAAHGGVSLTVIENILYKHPSWFMPGEPPVWFKISGEEGRWLKMSREDKDRAFECVRTHQMTKQHKPLYSTDRITHTHDKLISG